jgi:sugar O-acyltransferase (sialic acid O-acetyltransferase NeuD family)
MKKALIGSGGHSKEVMSQMDVKLPVFVDDRYLVSGSLPLSEFDPLKYAVMICIADPGVRNSIVERLPKETKYFTFIHPTALVMGEVEIGEGSFIGSYSILTTGIKIGNHAILNRGNHIGHDCIIGNYFSAMPGAIVSGDVHIGNRVYLGTNSSVIEKKYLLHDIKLGANSVVVRDINESGVYVGCPARKILQNGA